MKKLISVCLIFVIFSSCKSESSNQSFETTLNYPFTCSADILYSNFSASCDLCFKNTASATLEFTAPETVKGLVLSFDGEKMTADFSGITFLVEGDTASIAKLLFETISASKTRRAKKSDTKNEINLTLNGYEFNLTFDKKSGKPLKLSIPSQKFEASFYDFKILS